MRIASLLISVTVAAACGHTYNQGDLQIAMSSHHGNLRWGRVENAALNVDPQLRAAFVAEWTGKLGSIELQEVEVVGIAMAEDGKSADVNVMISFVERETMSVRQMVLMERWERTFDGWVAKKPATMQPPAPSATAAAPVTDQP